MQVNAFKEPLSYNSYEYLNIGIKCDKIKTSYIIKINEIKPQNSSQQVITQMLLNERWCNKISRENVNKWINNIKNLLVRFKQQ